MVPAPLASLAANAPATRDPLQQPGQVPAAVVKRFSQQQGQRSAAGTKPFEEVEAMQRYQSAATAGEAPVI